MKKTTIFLTASLCLALSCTSKKEAKVPENTKPSVPVVRTNGLKIAFYNQDSLKEGFIYFKNMDEMVKRKQIAFQNQLGTKEKELQNFVATNEERVKLGQLSAFEIQSIQQEAQKKEQTLYQLQQTQGAKLEKETVDLLNVIGKKIEAAGKKYCEKHKIDLLLVQSAGSQFNYINPTMDVTKEFIAFLNQEQDLIEKDIKGKK